MSKWVIAGGGLREAMMGPEPVTVTHRMTDQTSESLTKRVAFDGIFFNTTAEFEAEVSEEDREALRPFVAIWDQQQSYQVLRKQVL